MALKSSSWLADLPRAVIAGRELVAVARTSWLMRHDIGEPIVPQECADGADVVVCLHGLFATAGVLRPLRQRLEQRGCMHTATMTYGVGPGVPTLARRLGELLVDLPSNVAIHLLGHSVGGIVARYYAQHIGDPRIVQTISLAAPFAGVPHARWLGMDIARDLDPSSALLRELRLASHRSLGAPHLSIVADGDHVLGSPVAHALPAGDVIVVRQSSHNALLYRDDVAALIERRVVDRSRS